MISVDEVRAHILDACPLLAPRAVALSDAVACVSAEAVVSGEDVPPFANTAMDGYAVRATDTASAPVTLAVVGTLAAGAAPDLEVGPGQAVRIMTGAPLPPGADAVVMVEGTRAGHDPGTVVVETAAAVGDHVLPAGDDVAVGQEVMGPGTVVTPGHLGVLASIGRETVTVVPRPRVGVLSTGDELVAGAGRLRPGQIRDSNRPVLLALVAEAGAEPVDLGLVGDDVDVLAAVVQRGVDSCDALLTTGGVSVGDFDYVKTVLDRLGRMHGWQVAVRPAKPLAFGLVGDIPVFGLPGNPVSSRVSFELFARPALRRMMAQPVLDRPRVTAVADEAFARRPDGKLHLVRVVADQHDDGRWHVRSSGGQGSHMLAAMAAANALAVLPDGDGVAVGGSIQAMLLGSG